MTLYRLLIVGAMVTTIACGSAAAEEERNSVECTGQKPVKLLVGLVYLDQNKTRFNFGSVIMCWDKEIESESDLKRLHAAFKTRKKGDETTILGITTLRN